MTSLREDRSERGQSIVALGKDGRITCLPQRSIKPGSNGSGSSDRKGCLSQVSCQAQNALYRSIRSLRCSSTQMAIAVYNRSVSLPPQCLMQLIIALSGHHCWAVIVKSERTPSLDSSRLLPFIATLSSSIICPLHPTMLFPNMTWPWLASFLTHRMPQLLGLLPLLLKSYRYKAWHLVSFHLFRPATAPLQILMVPGQRPNVLLASLKASCHQLLGQASLAQGFSHLVQWSSKVPPR